MKKTISLVGDNAPQDFPDRFWEKLLLARQIITHMVE
jgi:hypothetical protein